MTENKAWLFVVYYVNVIDHYLGLINIVDKAKLVLTITWLWAMVGLYITKLFEQIFLLILKTPDNWLGIPANVISPVKNSMGKNIHIISASTDKGNITNKFKLFLKFYWETINTETHSFDFANLTRLLNCSMLYCCYLLNDDNNVDPATFLNNVNKFLIECKENTYVRRNNDDDTTFPLLFRRVEFEGNNAPVYDLDSDLEYVRGIVNDIDNH